MRLRLMVISSTFVLAACVPRAGTDYPVASKAAPAAQSNPQIVAEQDWLLNLPVGAPQMSGATPGKYLHQYILSKRAIACCRSQTKRELAQPRSPKPII